MRFQKIFINFYWTFYRLFEIENRSYFFRGIIRVIFEIFVKFYLKGNTLCHDYFT